MSVLPDLLGTYGDSGNATVLARRLAWRHVPVELVTVRAAEQLPTEADLYVLGGGEDVSQVQALRVLQSSTFDQAVQDGAHVFAVCAGLQLLGHRFATADGMVEGLGLLDVCSDRLPERVVGEVLATPPSSFGIAPITGFSNHAGATVLGSGVEPLAAVVQGRGNTGLTGEAEGAVQGRIVGTYLHGPVLARNPELADWLLERMCDGPLEPLAVGAPELLHAERTRVGQQPKTWRARTKAV